MSFGRTIRIYLKNGSVTGIRHTEIVNWTGQAIFIPRSLVKEKELEEWDESKRPGIYFLFGIDENSIDRKAVYIGESENILSRLDEHLAKKEFWNEAVFFTSKDDNLTKSHIKYLESRLIEMSKNAQRYTILNGNDGTRSLLPRSDKDSMEEFISNIRILLGTMGHKVLEPIMISQDKQISHPTEERKDIELTLKAKLSAEAIYTDEGIVVKKGSEANKSTQPSLSNGYKTLKETLVSEGILKEKTADLYEFTDNYLFKSSSQAAAIIAGYSISGPQSWSHNGKTLKEIEGN